MELTTLLKNTIDQGFSGKINLLRSDSGQYHGAIYLAQGVIVGGQYRQLQGADAVILMCYHSLSGPEAPWGEAKFVAEPEVLSPALQVIQWNFNELQVALHRYIAEWEEAKKLMPDPSLHLLAHFPSASHSIDHDLFQILSVLTVHHQVAQVFYHSPFLPPKTLDGLVRLRKMGLLRVVRAV